MTSTRKKALAGGWGCVLFLSPVAGPEPAGSGEAQLGGGRAQGWQVGVGAHQREGAMAVIYRTLTHGHGGTMLVWWSRSPNKVAVGPQLEPGLYNQSLSSRQP